MTNMRHDQDEANSENQLPYEPPRIESVELSEEAAEALT